MHVWCVRFCLVLLLFLAVVSYASVLVLLIKNNVSVGCFSWSGWFHPSITHTVKRACVWFDFDMFFFQKNKKGRKHVERSLLAAVFACFTQTCSFLRILNLTIYYCCQMFGLVLGSYVWSFDFDGFNSCLIPRECVWVWSVLHMSVLFCFLSCFLLEFMGARV